MAWYSNKNRQFCLNLKNSCSPGLSCLWTRRHPQRISQYFFCIGWIWSDCPCFQPYTFRRRESLSITYALFSIEMFFCDQYSQSLYFVLAWGVFFTHSWPRLETDAWSCGTSLESRNRSGRTVFGLLTGPGLLPQNTLVAQARTDLTEKAFPTEL